MNIFYHDRYNEQSWASHRNWRHRTLVTENIYRWPIVVVPATDIQMVSFTAPPSPLLYGRTYPVATTFNIRNGGTASGQNIREVTGNNYNIIVRLSSTGKKHRLVSVVHFISVIGIRTVEPTYYSIIFVSVCVDNSESQQTPHFMHRTLWNMTNACLPHVPTNRFFLSD